MKIVKTVTIELAEEEREVLQKAQDILMTFKNYATASDEETLQDMYAQKVDGYEHDFALPTAIDLLDTILNGVEEKEEEATPKPVVEEKKETPPLTPEQARDAYIKYIQGL